MKMNRREFLLSSAALSASGMLGLGSSWNLWAAPSGGSNAKLLVVFLRGAYDSANTLIPYADPFYYEARPKIAIARPNGNSATSAIQLDNRWGLSPALRDTIYPYFQNKQLAFIPFSGTEFVSRSHFQAQDWMEFGRSTNQRHDKSSGFLNRALNELGKNGNQLSKAVSFTSTLPLVFRGSKSVPNAKIVFDTKDVMDDKKIKLIKSMYADSGLLENVEYGFDLRKQIINETMSKPHERASGREFATQGAIIGKLMADSSYSIGFAEVPGWDTHINQGNHEGHLSYRLRNLGDGLNAMAKAMGPSWKNTTVIVMSEFGRTFRENGNMGTDHGHGSAIWVLGGSVHGGRIVGEQTAISQNNLHQNRDLPVLNDYRNVVAECISGMYGLNNTAINNIFPGLKRSSAMGIV